MKNLKIVTVGSRFLLLGFMFMASCSTRKVVSNTVIKAHEIEKLETEKKDFEVKENANIKITNDLIETLETTTEKKIYAPLDPTKPGLFTDENGLKKELHNTSYTEEKTTAKNTKKGKTKSELFEVTTKTDKGLKKESTRTKAKTALKGKNAARYSFSWWWLLLLFVPLGIYAFRRWRDIIWWF